MRPATRSAPHASPRKDSREPAHNSPSLSTTRTIARSKSCEVNCAMIGERIKTPSTMQPITGSTSYASLRKVSREPGHISPSVSTKTLSSLVSSSFARSKSGHSGEVDRAIMGERPASAPATAVSRKQQLKGLGLSLPNLQSSSARTLMIDAGTNLHTRTTSLVRHNLQRHSVELQRHSTSLTMPKNNSGNFKKLSSGTAFYSRVIARQVAQANEQAAARAESRYKSPQKLPKESLPLSPVSKILQSILGLVTVSWQMCVRLVMTPYHVTHMPSMQEEASPD